MNACVIALIASSVLRLGKTTLKNRPSVIIFLTVLALAAAGTFVPFPGTWWGRALDTVLSPAILIVCAGVAGCPGAERGAANEHAHESPNHHAFAALL